MYAKTVTLGGTHWEQTNEILFRNRRIGCRCVFRFVQAAAFFAVIITFPRNSRSSPVSCSVSELIPPLRCNPSYCSMSGLAQFVAARGLATLQEWCEEGYSAVRKVDEELSGEMNVG